MIVALAGGVGGAKLAQGLYHAVPRGELHIIGNTADDFEQFGLRVCPDLDTVLYTLAGLANPVTGWGIAGDTFRTLDQLARYGAATWFQIGDRDFAIHIHRTDTLRQGASLTAVTRSLTNALGVHATLLPMCDTPVSTMVMTPSGNLSFQDYFVRRQHGDTVLGVRFTGIEDATLPDPVATALDQASVIVGCPSNPLVSLGPILAVPGMRDRLRAARGIRVAVSPIVGGKALKGPAGEMLATLGHEVSALGVARLYHDFLDGFVLDRVDADLAPAIETLGPRTLVTNTVMGDADDRARLAHEVLAFAAEIAATRQPA